MRFPPNRIEELRTAIQQGDSVDLNRVALLQALDLDIVARQFVEDAISRNEAEDERFAQLANELVERV